MIWLPVVGFLIGFYAIWHNNVTVPSAYASYLSLATLAGIDTILGGIRSGLEGRFQSDIFISGFFVNTVMAALLAYFGDMIGVEQLYLAAVVVLGWRIFLNLSLIRRHILGRVHTHPRHTDKPLPGVGRPSIEPPVESVERRPPSSLIGPEEPGKPAGGDGEDRPNPTLVTPVEAP